MYLRATTVHQPSAAAAAALFVLSAAVSADAVPCPPVPGVAYQRQVTTPPRGLIATDGTADDHTQLLGVRNFDATNNGRGDLGAYDVILPPSTHTGDNLHVDVGTLVTGDTSLDGCRHVYGLQEPGFDTGVAVALTVPGAAPQMCLAVDAQDYFWEPDTLALAGTPDDNKGVVAFDYSDLVRVSFPNRCDPCASACFEKIDTKGNFVAPGTLVSGPGKVFGISGGRIFAVSRVPDVEPPPACPEGSRFHFLRPCAGSRLPLPLDETAGSLALAGVAAHGRHFGLVAIDVNGGLVHARSAGGCWNFQPIDTWGWTAAPGSLISANMRVAGVTEAEGRVFNTWIDAYDQVRFGLLDYNPGGYDPNRDFHPRSLAVAGDIDGLNCGLYGMRTDGMLVNMQWAGFGNPYEFSDVAGTPVGPTTCQVVPESIISGPLGIYGIDKNDQLFQVQCIPGGGTLGFRSLTGLSDWD